MMAVPPFRPPGFGTVLDQPETYITGLMRNFGEASQALGVAVDRLVLRFAAPGQDGPPDYQIQTLDGEDFAAFSGATHDLLDPDDITARIEEDRLQMPTYTIEDARDWLNVLNGEGGSGAISNPILTDQWREGDVSDPRD
jgi:hypothetical protein